MLSASCGSKDMLECCPLYLTFGWRENPGAPPFRYGGSTNLLKNKPTRAGRSPRGARDFPFKPTFEKHRLTFERICLTLGAKSLATWCPRFQKLERTQKCTETRIRCVPLRHGQNLQAMPWNSKLFVLLIAESANHLMYPNHASSSFHVS